MAGEPCWKRLIPKTTVYFPKYVTINNPRLAVLYWLFVIVTMAIALYQFLAKQRYLVNKQVWGDVSVNTGLTLMPMALARAQVAKHQAGLCAKTANGKYDYNAPDVSFTGIQCADLCGFANSSASCVDTSEYVQMDMTSLRIPSFYQDAFYNGTTGVYNTATRNYFIPGIEALSVAFSHSFASDPPSSTVLGDKPQLVGDSAFTDKEAQATDLVKTVVFDTTGKLWKTFEPGSSIQMTVAEILAAAKVNEFNDDVSRMILDEPYTSLHQNIRGVGPGRVGPTLRLTGADISINLYYTNQGGCRQTDTSSFQRVSWNARLCCISIRAVRSWVSWKRTAALDASGSTITRSYNGLRIEFDSKGTFSFFDFQALFDGLTTVLIWAQIPLIMIYYFIVTFLGSLSTIYSRVIHQEMSIRSACTGLAARLMVNSSAFLDLRESGTGIPFKKLLDRLQYVLQYSKDLDEDEVKKFAHFIYQGMIQAGDVEGTDQSVDVQAFCSSCASNESLSFGSLVQIFNTNRRIGCIERLFQDDTIKEIHAKVSEMEKHIAEESAGEGEVEVGEGHDPTIKDPNQHSLLERIIGYQSEYQERFAALSSTFEATSTLAKEAIAQHQEHIWELRRQEVLKAGAPEKRPPQKLESGAIYTGEWVGVIRHGAGIETWPDGSMYEGQWEVGKVHGRCIYRLPNGAKYEGMWRNGVQHGEGFEVAADGAKYQGQYENGTKNGAGTFFMVDGSTYKGQVVDNMMHGKGLYEWSNGHSYDGQWQNDLMHGQGVYLWPDGIKYEGQYRNNLKDGTGIFTWPDGRRYEGEYKDNEREGKGVFKMPDGTRVEGTWRQGKQHGDGTIVAPNGKVQSARWDMGTRVPATVLTTAEAQAS